MYLRADTSVGRCASVIFCGTPPEKNPVGSSYSGSPDRERHPLPGQVVREPAQVAGSRSG
jgi:hypothetical protein